MKWFFCVLCVLCVALSICSPFAAAVDAVEVPVVEDLPQAELSNVDPGTALEILYWGQQVVILVRDGVEYVLELFDGDGNMGDNIVNVSGDGGGSVAVVTQDLLVPEEEPAADTLVGTVVAMFGPYSPLTYEVTTYVGDEAIVTTEVVPGLAGMDWPWICGFSLFSICAYSLFRLMGVVLG